MISADKKERMGNRFAAHRESGLPVTNSPNERSKRYE